MKALLILTEGGARQVSPANIQTLRYDVINGDTLYCFNGYDGYWYRVGYVKEIETTAEFYKLICAVEAYKKCKFKYIQSDRLGEVTL